MFSEKNKKPDFSKEQNKVAQGTILTGDIVSEGSFRVDGQVNGNLKVQGKVVIGKTGYISGEIISESADIEGKFKGKLKVNTTLNLKSTANISGEVMTDQLQVEPGAIFNATCQMSGSVKSLKDEQQKEKSKIA